jgi:dolichol-phosphate mannosyltransferase
MDADLQDRPEVFAEFVKKWDEGYEVVFAVRTRRKERGLKRFAYWFFYRALQLVFPVRIPLDSGDFSLIDRRVVDVIKHAPERNRFMRGLRAWAGFRQVGIEVERGSREAGRSKYTVRKLFRLAADGVFSFSYVPLRLATWFGFCIAGTGFLVILVLLYLRIFTGVLPVTGFTSIIVAILFLGGIQLVAIGLLGEYVGRIYDEVKSRPLYLVREREGFSDTHHEA